MSPGRKFFRDRNFAFQLHAYKIQGIQIEKRLRTTPYSSSLPPSVHRNHTLNSLLMCLGQNSANHAVHYLNGQLSTLWENSVQCASHADKGLKPLERVRYDFALSEFHVGCKHRKSALIEDLMFSAVFAKPRLEFICNHEAVLYLKIKEGQVNPDFAHLETPSFTPVRNKTVKFSDKEIALRMEFDISPMCGHISSRGNGTHIIQMLVLNFATAKVASKVDIPGSREALSFYLKKYLDFLHKAGHHILFSLPDFDDDRLDVNIDYSLDSHIIRNASSEVTEVYGVSVNEINRNLSSKWLKAIMDAAEGADRNAICLAEYRSTWTHISQQSDIQFHVKFGAPKIKALCKRDVVLYFKIDELLVYDGHNFEVVPKHTYHDWTIAVVVDLVREVEGSVTRVKLDMTSWRLCEHLCSFTGLDFKLEFARTLKATFVEFFEYYTMVLERVRFHFVHVISISGTVIDTRGGEVPSSPLPACPKPGTVIKDTRTCGFDLIQVISVQSLIEQFRVMWQVSRESKAEYSRCLGTWSFAEDFKASFGALKMCLLSNDKALVWIQLDDGFLKPLNGAKKCDFTEWSVAFEVDFKMVEHEQVAATSKSWLSRFTESLAWKEYGKKTHDSTFKHLCLDFSTAKFVFEQSNFEDLELDCRTAVECVNGAVHYLTKHYFPHLTQHGHHILHTIPVWKSTSTCIPSMGLTSATFQVYSNYVYTRYNCRESSEAVLVILGMTQCRPLPKVRLEYYADWFHKHGRGLVHGTVCLSRSAFLEKRLLSLLAHVNANSTIVTTFPGREEDKDYVSVFTDVDGGHWDLALTTLGRRKTKKRADCDWEVYTGPEGNYRWDYTDKLSYEHEGSRNEKNNGTYTASCKTKNYLTLPSASDGSFDIVMHGETAVELGFKGPRKSWNTKAASKWSVTISMDASTTGCGLSIDVKGSTKPKFDNVDASVTKMIDLTALHSLLSVDVQSLTNELRQLFGGIWNNCFPGMQAYSLCHPVFNVHGDILFELKPWVPRSQLPPPSVKHRPSKGNIKGVPPTQPVPVPPRPIQQKKSTGFFKKLGDGLHDVIDTLQIPHGHAEQQPSSANGSRSSSPPSASEKETFPRTPANENGPDVKIADEIKQVGPLKAEIYGLPPAPKIEVKPVGMVKVEAVKGGKAKEIPAMGF